MTKRQRMDPDAIKTLISAPTRHARRVTSQQCTATSKRTQERCRAWAMVGRKTCRVHGSATKRSARAAEKVIAESKGYAAEMLVEFMADPNVDIKHRIQIAQDLLTRANVTGKTSVELSVADAYRDIVLASTRSVGADDLDDLDSDPNVIDAEVVDEAEDERVLERARLMDKRRRRGKQEALPPSQEKATARKVDITRDPREHPAFVGPEQERRARHEAWLEEKQAPPKKRLPNRTQRSGG